MAESRFLYVTFIRATPEAVWEHLTNPELNKLFWGGYFQRSNWKPGDDYEIVGPEGQAWDTGKVVVSDPPRRLEVTWLHEHQAEMKAEGLSACSFDLEPAGDAMTKLTVTHTMPIDGSKLIEAVSTGWPMILSSLKSLLETGKALG